MENTTKEVDFNHYCPLCQHKDDDENQEPCYDCLQEPVNTNSKKPVYFKAKE